MPCKSFLFSILAVFFLVAGCGLKEGVVQKAPRAYLWFTGKTEGAVVLIDDRAPFLLNESRIDDKKVRDTTATDADEIYYEINPGKHRIIVERSGKEVVNRILLLGNGMTQEIKIP